MGMLDSLKAARKQIQAYQQKSTAKAASSPGPTKAAQAPKTSSAGKKSSHRLTAANREFVKSYGFSDLSNDQVHQYREKAASIMRYVKKIDAKDPRISVSSRVRDFIKKAGADPKARGALSSLYGILAKDRAKLSSSQVMKLTGLLQRTGDLSSSRSARAAAMAMVKNPSFSKDKKVYALAPQMIQMAGASQKTAQKAAVAVDTMAGYVAKNSRKYGQLKLQKGYVKKNHPKATLGWPTLNKDLKSIARSKNPEKTATAKAKKLGTALGNAEKTTRSIEENHYTQVLHKGMGLGKKTAAKIGKKIYELGGPQSPAGSYLLACALRKRHGSLSKKQLQAKLSKHAQAMQKNSLKYHKQSFALKHQSLSVPSGKANSKKSFAQKIKKYMDPSQVGMQAADTMVTALALEETAVGTASSGLSVVAGVANIPLTLNEIGGYQRQFIEGEGAQYSKKGHLAAMEIARTYAHMPNMETAYSEAKRGQHTPRYALRPESFKAYKMAFEDTFRHMARMTKGERKNYIKAYDWVASNLK